MTTPGETFQPDLGQLLTKFLQRRGIEQPAVEATGEVVPFQAIAVLPVDPTTAFHEAVATAGYFLKQTAAASFEEMKSPSDWVALVRNQESTVAVPMCLGNFPQLLRDVGPLLSDRPRSELRSKGSASVTLPGLAEWGQKMAAKSRWAEALLAAGALRLAGQLDAASDLLLAVREAAPTSWQNLILNEQAALAWQRGEFGQAKQMWDSHPAADNPVVLFNRGLAALFMDRPDEAAALLTRAADALPEDSSWHHLARMYVTAGQA